jgi:hypothetical protein
MVPVSSLWLPIVLSAVAVFIASSILHMLLKYHQTDFDQLPSEDAVLDALRPHNIPPGDYVMPWGGGMEAMKDPAWLAKYERGPVGFVTIMRSGKPTMTKELVLWFIYSLVVSLFAAYVAGRARGPGAEYMDIFRFTSTVAFAGYVLALWQSTIWYKRKVSTNIKNTIDGFIYALVTAGVFGWLWPA